MKVNNYTNLKNGKHKYIKGGNTSLTTKAETSEKPSTKMKNKDIKLQEQVTKESKKNSVKGNEEKEQFEKNNSQNNTIPEEENKQHTRKMISEHAP